LQGKTKKLKEKIVTHIFRYFLFLLFLLFVPTTHNTGGSAVPKSLRGSEIEGDADHRHGQESHGVGTEIETTTTVVRSGAIGP